MSCIFKNLEQTLCKLDTIISMLETDNQDKRPNISLAEVITDLDIAIAKIKLKPKIYQGFSDLVNLS